MARLITLAEYQTLNPFQQGYVVYMQAEHEGSELKEHQKCPYPPDSDESEKWHRGQKLGIREAQDSEE